MFVGIFFLMIRQKRETQYFLPGKEERWEANEQRQ